MPRKFPLSKSLYRLAAVLVILGPVRAEGATIHVPEDQPSILVAVDVAVSGDSILVAAGTWTDRDTRLVLVGGNLLNITSAGFLKPGITIIGVDGPEVTIVDAGPADPAAVITFLHALPGTDVTRLEGLTITGGGDAIVVTSPGRLELESCHIVNNPRRAATFSFADVSLRDCLVEGNVTDPEDQGGAVSGSSSSLELFGCRVRDNANGGIVVDEAPSRVVIDGCEILDHSTGHGVDLDGVGDVYVARTLFSGNAVGGFAAGGGMSLGDCSGIVEFCVFEYDTSWGGAGGGLTVALSEVRVENNTFYGCHAVRGSAVAILGADARFAQNVVARSTGAEALWKSGGPMGAESGCNVIWANEGGDFFGEWDPGMPEIFADPQFCDPEQRDFTVAASSPALPENSLGLCGLIGAFGLGCPDRGTVVVGVTTVPLGFDILVDGDSALSPALFHATPGSTTTITLPAIVERDGRRYDFSHWLDGGGLVRTIVVPPVPTLFTAFWDSLFYLDIYSEYAGDGILAPSPGYRTPFSQVQISATPQPGRIFHHWLGLGDGAYTGIDSSGTATMGSPITEIAYFDRDVEVVLATDPPGLTVQADGVPYVAPTTFVWRRNSQHLVSTDAVQEPPGSGARHTFARWTDGGARTHTITVPNGPLTITAEFVTDYYLSFAPTIEGIMIPGDGWRDEHSVVTIEALENPSYIFQEWIGVGAGSYSGPDNPATVVMDGPIHQIAEFTRVAQEVTLSLSDVDPFVHTGPPIGFGSVYLWYVCSTEGGLARFEGDVAGSIPAFAFLPAPGILNGGSGTNVKLAATECQTGPALLGAFLVQDDAGGGLSLVPAPDTSFLRGHDCSSSDPPSFPWPTDLRITGVRTDGTEPVPSGRGCGEDDVPVAIVLSGLTAEVRDREVVVRWSTSHEELHDGFRVYRAPHAPGPYSRLHDDLVRGRSPYSWTDGSVEGDREYFYEIGALDLEGRETMYGPVRVATPPWPEWTNGLARPRPNPVTGGARLAFTLARDGEVSLSIYDVGGRRVRRVLAAILPAGAHDAWWDARDDRGRRVPSGVYFARVESGAFRHSERLVVLRRE